MPELPAYTIEMARLFDAPAHAQGVEERYRAEYDALARALGTDQLRERCGSERFEECDLARLDALFLRVKAEYEAPQEEAQARRLDELAKQLGRIDLDKLSRVLELGTRQQARQGFRRVV